VKAQQQILIFKNALFVFDKPLIQKLCSKIPSVCTCVFCFGQDKILLFASCLVQNNSKEKRITCPTSCTVPRRTSAMHQYSWHHITFVVSEPIYKHEVPHATDYLPFFSGKTVFTINFTLNFTFDPTYSEGIEKSAYESNLSYFQKSLGRILWDSCV
jgi:hypothetical protein